MAEAEGRVAKQFGGRGWYATVRLSLVPAAGREVVAVPSAADGWQLGEGWLEAAAAGTAVGLELAGATGRCEITGVHGMVCDTSPGVVALAAVRAAWAACGFEPDEALVAAVEGCVDRGHQFARDAILAELVAVAPDAEPGTAADGGGV